MNFRHQKARKIQKMTPLISLDNLPQKNLPQSWGCWGWGGLLNNINGLHDYPNHPKKPFWGKLFNNINDLFTPITPPLLHRGVYTLPPLM